MKSRVSDTRLSVFSMKLIRLKYVVKDMKKFIFTLLLTLFLSTQATAAPTDYKTALFAGGCFWCMQPPFDAAHGVIKTKVGYTGGVVANPTYKTVSSGKTGHTEAILSLIHI